MKLNLHLNKKSKQVSNYVTYAILQSHTWRQTPSWILPRSWSWTSMISLILHVHKMQSQVKYVNLKTWDRGVYHGHGIVGTKKNKDCMSNDQSRKKPQSWIIFYASTMNEHVSDQGFPSNSLLSTWPIAHNFLPTLHDKTITGKI